MYLLFFFHFSDLQDHLLKMNKQKPKLQDLTEQAAGLLTFDLCQQYDPAHNLREECREVEERWDKLEERLQLALQEVEDAVSTVECLLNVQGSCDPHCWSLWGSCDPTIGVCGIM